MSIQTWNMASKPREKREIRGVQLASCDEQCDGHDEYCGHILQMHSMCFRDFFFLAAQQSCISVVSLSILRNRSDLLEYITNARLKQPNGETAILVNPPQHNKMCGEWEKCSGRRKWRARARVCEPNQIKNFTCRNENMEKNCKRASFTSRI